MLAEANLKSSMGLLLFCALSAGNVYGANRCIDQHGKITYTDVVCPGATGAVGRPIPSVAAQPTQKLADLKINIAGSSEKRERPKTTPFTYEIAAANFNATGAVDAQCNWLGRIDIGRNCGSDHADLTRVYILPSTYKISLICRDETQCAISRLCGDIRKPDVDSHTNLVAVAVDPKITEENVAVVRKLMKAVDDCRPSGTELHPVEKRSKNPSDQKFFNPWR